MGFLSRWSKIPLNNQNADPAINWSEGQLGPTYNDSARAEMATMAQWRDDNSGLILSTGTAAAYVITMSQDVDSYRDGMTVAFRAHVTNTGASTINVNGLGAKAIRETFSLPVAAGSIRADEVAFLTYYQSSDSFVVLNSKSQISIFDVSAPGGVGVDDTARLQAACDRATGRTLNIGAGTWKVKGLIFRRGTTVMFHPDAILTPFDTTDNVNSTNTLAYYEDGVTFIGWRSEGVIPVTGVTFPVFGQGVNPGAIPITPVFHLRNAATSVGASLRMVNTRMKGGSYAFNATDANNISISDITISDTVGWQFSLSNNYRNVLVEKFNFSRCWQMEPMKHSSGKGYIPPTGGNNQLVIQHGKISDWCLDPAMVGKDGIDGFMASCKMATFRDIEFNGPGVFELKPCTNTIEVASGSDFRYEDIFIQNIRASVKPTAIGDVSGGIRLHWASAGAAKAQGQFRRVTMSNIEVNYTGAATAPIGSLGYWVGLCDDVIMENCRTTGFDRGITIGEDLPTIAVVDGVSVYTGRPMLSTTGTGSATVFDMVASLNLSAYAVYLNNILQPTGWTIDQVNSRITFATPPGAGVAIRVYQRTAGITTAIQFNLKTINCEFRGNNIGGIIPAGAVIQNWSDYGSVFGGADKGLAQTTSSSLVNPVFNGTYFYGGETSTPSATSGGWSITEITRGKAIGCRFVSAYLYCVYSAKTTDLAFTDRFEFRDCSFELINSGNAAQALRLEGSGFHIYGGTASGVVAAGYAGCVRLAAGKTVTIDGLTRTELSATTPTFRGCKGERVLSSAAGRIAYLCTDDGVIWV